ncbi:hypothetical protein ADN00_17395 [Ornatilinea apprima]|uniref:Bacterial transcriptional activator domain-containing protein n=1 Tax=Ornatilinea apprima TaxID=1134406 RepID=A0A0P6X8F6_9CHLR|nr:tetratricopeptide repeat protein [Ornatilinea apprima]KPL71457.1 hypothetical protein ADN00_17395 [Ornatilinea apprima]
MNQDFPIIRTRITPPRRRGDLVTRPRLEKLLYDLVDNRLTIIAAPAGYGKTSLLIEFTSKIQYATCWYTVDALDRDPERFLSYFIAALSARFPEFGHRSRAALLSSHGELNLEHINAILLNDVLDNIPEHFVLVLDDFHLVNGIKMIEDFISRFIQDMDENGHIVIASRTLISLPDFPLMVARSQVGGLSFEELAFQEEELINLFSQNYSNVITTDTAREWISKTEGWITGLLLSAQPIQQASAHHQRALRVTGIGLTEYLEQILDSYPPDMQEFLMFTALFEEFDPDLCTAVLNRALDRPNFNWNPLIDRLLQENLFVLPVGEDGLSLRYHHLFRDFLQTRVLRTLPEEARLIQLSLAESISQQGDFERAFRIYQKLEDYDQMASLVENAAASLLARGRAGLLNQWVEAIPRDIYWMRPSLISIRGAVLLSQGSVQEAINLLNQAIRELERNDQPIVLARALVRRATGYRIAGNYESALSDADRALALCGQQPSSLIYAEALRVKGNTLYMKGDLKEALHCCSQSLKAYQVLGEKENEAIVLMDISLLYAAQGNYVDAEMSLTQVYEYWKQTENSEWKANVLINLGELQSLNGNYIQAEYSLEEALKHVQITASTRLEAYALATIGDVYRNLQAPNEALKAYRQAYVLAQRNQDNYLLVFLDLAESALLRLQGKNGKAEERLETAWKNAQKSGSSFEQSLCYKEMGAIKLAIGAPDMAITHLGKALDAFEAQNQMIEAAQTIFYLAIAHAQRREITQGQTLLEKALRLTQPLRQQPLISLAAWMKKSVAALEKGDSSEEIKEFLHKVDQFERNVPAMRKSLRQNDPYIPFAPPRMRIRAFGKIEVWRNDKLVTNQEWQAQSSRDLFYILLTHPEGLTKETIGAIFWPEISNDDLRFRFKNTMYRLRHAVGRDTILLEDNYYRFNRLLDYDFDVENFLREMRLAQKSVLETQKIEHCRKAIEAYQGPFLPEIEEDWAYMERTRLMQHYINILLELSELYLKQKEFIKALETCQKALQEDSCNEASHRLAMRIHAAMGNRAEVARQFERCQQALKEEINVNPSPETRALLESLTR